MRETKYPKRSLGQNFLIDNNIAEKIVSALNIEKSDTVLEIGPGKGALTRHILKKTDKVILVEKDRHLAEFLSEKFKNSTIINKDFLELTPNDINKGIKVIGNLPYNVSTQIIFSVLKNHSIYKSAVFMVQKEVAERIISKYNCKSYSMLSVICQSFGNWSKLFHVSPSCFYPKPNVISTVLKCTVYNKYNIKNFEKFFLFVKAINYGKRKKVINSIKENPFLKFNNDFLNRFEKSYNGNIRVGELSVEDIVNLYKINFENNKDF